MAVTGELEGECSVIGRRQKKDNTTVKSVVASKLFSVEAAV